MKRVNGLFERLISLDGIIEDIITASKHKRQRAEVKQCIGDYKGSVTPELMRTAKRIQKMYLRGFELPEPSRYTITDGLSKKKRTISVPKFFPYQIMTHGIVRVMSHVFHRGMYRYSCASIPGRGIHFAMRTVKKWLHTDKTNTKYFAKIDIKKFFDSVDIIKLKTQLVNRIKDNEFLEIIFKFITGERGLPIGSYLSQWLANLYLEPLDHFIKETTNFINNSTRGRKKPHKIYYIRYMDDMVIFNKNKKILHKMLHVIKGMVNSELNMKVKGDWQVSKFIYTDKEGVTRGQFLDFVGFRFHRKYVTIRQRVYRRINYVVYKLNKSNNKGKLSRSILSYYGWIKHTNSDKFQNRLSKVIPLSEVKKMAHT